MYKVRHRALGCGRGPRVTDRRGLDLVGPGFIAAHPMDAVRRLGAVDVVGVAGSSLASSAAVVVNAEPTPSREVSGIARG